VRNLFAPVLAGGSTILCPAFDPNLFWDIVEESDPTWYYASPSMHSTILGESANRKEALAKSKIRLVCNAAGGLLPSLAIQIRDTFNCIVLPSYGMTECMPISTPPLNYKLERSGTSGVSVGPELAIMDGNDNHQTVGTVGRIHVRGAPVFPGYLKPTGVYDKTPFNTSGWFDTGDMGYLDEDGYLYITGRSKEVINRGGELISPFEVEEAMMIAAQDPNSPIYGRVSENVVFSAPHDVLQEVVGVVLVTPPGQPRVDLRQLHDAVKSSLHSVKWPTVIVYMDGVPKGNNKVLRVKLGERLSFDPLSDDMTLGNKHFEAQCPPVNSPLTLKIEKQLCNIDLNKVLKFVHSELGAMLDGYVTTSHIDDLPEIILAPKPDNMPFNVPDFVLDNFKNKLRTQLDGYLVPSHVKVIDVPLPIGADGVLDEVSLGAIVKAQNKDTIPEGIDGPERKLREIFADLLACSQADISADSDFFEMGGDSLKAGRLLSLIRKEFNVRLPIGMLFTNSSMSSLCTLVEEHLPETGADDTKGLPQIPLPGCQEIYSSTNPFLLILQLVPITILYPMKRALQWTILLYSLSTMLKVFPGQTQIYDRFIFLVISIWIATIVTSIVAPICGIIVKWLVVGKYKEGMYPMWGPYHTRWWFTEKCLAVGGKVC
jgi:acyl carrier protein